MLFESEVSEAWAWNFQLETPETEVSPSREKKNIPINSGALIKVRQSATLIYQNE